MGGLLAYEMARQFASKGELTELLTMIDTHPPAPEPDVETSRLVLFAAHLGRLFAKDLREMAQRFLELSPEAQWQMLLEKLVEEEILPLETAQQKLTAMLNVFTKNSMAVENYSLQESSQNIVLFRAAEAEKPEQLAEEWSHWAGKTVELHLISGNHYTMIQRLYVSQLARLLKGRFEENETGSVSNQPSS